MSVSYSILDTMWLGSCARNAAGSATRITFSLKVGMTKNQLKPSKFVNLAIQSDHK